MTNFIKVFVPSRGFLFFYLFVSSFPCRVRFCFRPLTGISLFLLYYTFKNHLNKEEFSSPHGDFSFSIVVFPCFVEEKSSFRPLTGISLFLSFFKFCLLFLPLFSSPHGDFSFSILSHIPLINQGLFL